MAWDVIVVGGGLAGVSVCLELVRGGARTLLIDHHHAGRATDAGAGILSPETSMHPDPSWYPLVRAARDHYPGLVAGLPGDTGYAPCGLLGLALGDWDVEGFEAVLAAASGRSASVVEVAAEAAAERVPVLGTVTQALSNPGAARVDGRRLAAAMLDAAVGAGLEVRDGLVSEVGGVGGGVGVDGSPLAAGSVVIAGGAWTPSLAAQLGVNVPVAPVRGQIVHFELEGVDTGAWPIVQPVLGMYLVAWPGGRVAVGATHETSAGFATRPTGLGLRQVLSEVKRVYPGLLDAVFLEVRVGLRPVSADDLPVLGPLERHPNVHLATGYGANGLLLSPWCGHLVAAGLLGTASEGIDPAWRPDRFSPPAE